MEALLDRINGTQPFAAVSCNLGNPEHIDPRDDSPSFARWYRSCPHLPAPTTWWLLFPAVGLAIELEVAAGVR